ncbi:response regulator [Shigella flexneri]
MTHDNIDLWWWMMTSPLHYFAGFTARLGLWQPALRDSGRQALEQVREQLDLVLCDVRMAEMDGIATLKGSKALNPAIPVLIMTAYSGVETAVEALKTGALGSC